MNFWLLGGRKEEGIIREFGMDMYTLLCLKWITNKDQLYIARGTLLNVMWQPGWERGLGGECENLSVMSNSLGSHGQYSQWNFPGQNIGVGSLSLFQGIFPTQESNPCLPHCRQIPYQLSHKGSPRILEWAVYPFSSGSSWSRNRTRVSFIAGGFFTNWAIREST